MTSNAAGSNEPFDALAQRESGRVVSVLLRLLGDIDDAEDVWQETLMTALERWPVSGMPDNPGAWLMTVARNRALDVLRRKKLHEHKLRNIAGDAAACATDVPMDEPAIPDERLRLIFTCCHPALAMECRVALTLKLVAGLPTRDIARAFLIAEPAVAQRIVRAKRAIQEGKYPYAVPDGVELAERLDAVLAVLYLIFNAGYTARDGRNLVRIDLVDEAIRLSSLLADLMPKEAEVLNLLALMELHASRSVARTDEKDRFVSLEHQDRSRWDMSRITHGLTLLERAEALEPHGPYGIQAEIAACHARARVWADTDWQRIAALYAQLADVAPSPVVTLNWAAAISMVDGPVAALAFLDAQTDCDGLSGYYLFPATRADLLRRCERFAEAAAEYRKAEALTDNEMEQNFLRMRTHECEMGAASRAQERPSALL